VCRPKPLSGLHQGIRGVFASWPRFGRWFGSWFEQWTRPMRALENPLVFFCFLPFNQVLSHAHNPLVPGSSPGGPTMLFMGLGGLCREAEGLGSLGVGHR
jgi:hypothetical protein